MIDIDHHQVVPFLRPNFVEKLSTNTITFRKKNLIGK